MKKIKLMNVGDKFVKKCPVDENNQSLLTIVEEDGVQFAAFLNDETAKKIVHTNNHYDDLLNELKNIANANYHRWEDGLNTSEQFVQWAQSRARFAISKTEG